jgi:hypothetical protein
MRAQSLATLGAQSPLWKLKDNIFPHIGRQVHEVLTFELLMEHKLVHAQGEIEYLQASAASQGRWRAQLTRDKQRIPLELRV